MTPSSTERSLMTAFPPVRTLLACALTLTTLPAWADRPLVSETADVIPASSCQVEAALGRTTQSGSPTEKAGAALFSCGVAGVHQFGFAAQESRADGARARALTLTGKTTLRMPDKGQPGFGIAYTLGFEKADGQGLRRESATVLGVVTQEVLDGVLLHANLGWAHSRSAGQSTTTWSLGVEKGDGIVLAADVFGDDRSRPWVSAGAGWALLDKLSFNAAYAMNFERKRVKQLSVGMKIVF